MDGFIKIHRSIAEWEWYTDCTVKSVFLHLLIMANHVDTRWRGRVIRRGQRLTSVRHLADELKLCDQAIQRALRVLVASGSIVKESDRKLGTMITIVNYDRYQCDDRNVVGSVVNTTTPTTTLTTTLTTTKQECKEYYSSSYTREAEKKISESGEPRDDGAKAEEIVRALAYLMDEDEQCRYQVRKRGRGMSPEEAQAYYADFANDVLMRGGDVESGRRLVLHFANWLAIRLERQDREEANRKRNENITKSNGDNRTVTQAGVADIQRAIYDKWRREEAAAGVSPPGSLLPDHKGVR